ncbi:MAG TPA: MFS transporter [Chloroflexota bacterium]|nr:MFS transporter [Chloroflexota bacterium]
MSTRFTAQQFGLVAVVAAVFLGSLDQTVIVAALPAIVSDLQIPFDRLDQAAWIVSGYLLGYTVTLPVVGQLADVRGRALSFAGALIVFVVGSLGCALASSLGPLIAARLLQAMGGGALLPVAVAIVSDRYPPEQRALAIGVVGAVAEAGGVLGPLYGAVIIAHLAWRWIFWLNVPFAVLFLALAMRFGRLPPSYTKREQIDWPGAVLFSLALAALMAGLSREPIFIIGDDVRPTLLVLALVALVACLGWQSRARNPLLEIGLFRIAGFGAGIAGGFLLGGALIVAMVDVPLYAATILVVSPADGGLLLMRLTSFIPIGAILGGLLAQRWGLRLPTLFGFVAAGLGLLAMATWGTAPEPRRLWLSLAMAGLGFGLLIAPLATATVNAAGQGREASAAALFSVARLTGMAIGLSVLTAWGLQHFDDLAASIPLPLPVPGESAAQSAQRLATYAEAIRGVGAQVYHDIFQAAAILCFVGMVVAVFMGQKKERVKPLTRKA